MLKRKPEREAKDKEEAMEVEMKWVRDSIK